MDDPTCLALAAVAGAVLGAASRAAVSPLVQLMIRLVLTPQERKARKRRKPPVKKRLPK